MEVDKLRFFRIGVSVDSGKVDNKIVELKQLTAKFSGLANWLCLLLSDSCLVGFIKSFLSALKCGDMWG